MNVYLYMKSICHLCKNVELGTSYLDFDWYFRINDCLEIN